MTWTSSISGMLRRTTGARGQDGRRDAGQGRVLVAARLDPSLDGESAFDEVLMHGPLYDAPRGLVNDAGPSRKRATT